MNKQKLYGWLVAALLLINVLLAAFIFFGKRDRLHGEGPKKLIIEKLGFDQKQAVEYESLIQWHRMEMERVNNEVFELKNQLYQSVPSTEKGEQDSLVTKLGMKQQEMEWINLKHFSDIRELCRGEQIQRFDELSKEIAALFRPHHPKEK